MTPAHDTPAVIYTRVSTHKQAETLFAAIIVLAYGLMFVWSNR